MNADDKLLIQDVIARYSYSYDGGNAEAFAQLLVEDAIFEVIVPTQARPVVGVFSPAAIRGWAAQRYELTAGTQARHHQGVYYDTWRKTSEGWRLVHRAAHLDRDPGFGSSDAVQST